MRLSAVDCLQRGALHLWANWELVLYRWLVNLLVGALVGLGVLVPLVGLGLDFLRRASAPQGPDLEETLELLLQHLTTPSLDWALAAGALLLFWGLAGCAYAYGEAGLYGLLRLADEAADGAVPRARPALRVSSWRGFFTWGGRYFRRYFGLINLFGAVLLAGFLPLLLGLLAVLAGGSGRPSSILLAGVGCVGMVIAVVVSLAATVWYWLAEAELALPEATVTAASRQALRLLGRRLGAILLILLVGLAALFAVSAVLFPFSSFGALLLRQDLVTQTLFQITCSLIQGLLATAPQIALAGALVALVRSERTPHSSSPLPRNSEVMFP